jgi:predicted Zn-dependent protease
MQQIVSQLGTVLLVNLLFGDLGGLAELAETGGQLLGLKFSRDHEREADALGVDLLRKAELPLNGVSGFFQRMAEFEKAVAVTSEAGKLMSILSTHPATEERIEFALKLVSDPNSKTPAAQQDAYRKLKSVFK